MHLLWYSLPLVCTPIGRHSLWYPLPVSLTLAFPPLLLRFQPLFLALSHSLSLSSASPADARQINVRAIVTWAPCPIVKRAPTPLLPRLLSSTLRSHSLSPTLSLSRSLSAVFPTRKVEDTKREVSMQQTVQQTAAGRMLADLQVFAYKTYRSPHTNKGKTCGRCKRPVSYTHTHVMSHTHTPM